MTEKEKQENLEELKLLYKETCEFIETKSKTDEEFRISISCLRVKKIVGKLDSYISDFENGKKCIVYRKEYWCSLIAQALYANPHNMLDDDNFPIDEEDY